MSFKTASYLAIILMFLGIILMFLWCQTVYENPDKLPQPERRVGMQVYCWENLGGP